MDGTDKVAKFAKYGTPQQPGVIVILTGRLRMQLEIPISFNRFGWTGIEERAKAEGVGPAQLMQEACAYYVGELDSGRIATKLPRFRSQHGGQVRVLTLELDERMLRRLEAEADRASAPLERMLAHVAIVYLADSDAGRIAERVARRAEATED